jgi:SAM-dependent methyltransferase
MTDIHRRSNAMTMTQPNKPDLVAIKQRQRQAWASGDYAAVAARIVSMAEQLIDSADLAAGSTVLDVATGTGNAALAAARSGATVTGIDYVPELLERARRRSAVEGFEIDFVEGDAERLPFRDAAFDAVTSCVGVMFAADQEQAASELLRVCRPGGSIALANWTPTSFVGGMLRTIARHVPPPAGVRSPLEWGTAERLADLLGEGVSELSVRPRTFVFRFRSPGDFVDFFRTNYGPVHTAFRALDEAGRDRLQEDLVQLVEEHDGASGSSVALPSEYLEAFAIRASLS